MPREPAVAHSQRFLEIRDLVLELDERDRRRLAALLGAMHESQPPLSADLVHVLKAFVQLDVEDRDRLGKWFGSFVNRWGQVPRMAAVRVPHPKP